MYYALVAMGASPSVLRDLAEVSALPMSPPAGCTFGMLLALVV